MLWIKLPPKPGCVHFPRLKRSEAKAAHSTVSLEGFLAVARRVSRTVKVQVKVWRSMSETQIHVLHKVLELRGLPPAGEAEALILICSAEIKSG